jgi:hypothetical protein
MNKVRRFLDLPRQDRLLLIRSVFLLAAIRIGLDLLSYARLRELLQPRGRPAGIVDPHYVGRVGWAIPRAAKFVPRATCLTQAMAAQYLLSRRGCPATIRIGVGQSVGRFSAHAWLLCGDRVVVGGSDASLARYTHLTDLPVQPQ